MGMDQDEKELMKALESQSKNYVTEVCGERSVRRPIRIQGDEGPPLDFSNPDRVQWTTSDNKIFVPAGKSTDLLKPGVYEINISQNIGIYFENIPVLSKDLIRFPNSNINKVVEEIQLFWECESRFREYDLVYKRGILLWGPPGSGKSCTIQLIMDDVISRGGICVKFSVPHLFAEGMRIFRSIQPDTPVVVLMEDIDSTIDEFSETQVLNILDGVDQIDKIVFLATTNYPELLGARIVNRPSRFDKRFRIPFPNREDRLIYLRNLIGKMKDSDIDIEKWADDTDEFSFAHLKELFVAVVILGDQYKRTLKTLRGMIENKITSLEDNTRKIGLR